MTNPARLAARPCDALDVCVRCGEWVRYGQSYRRAPAGNLVHETCPAPTTTGTDKVRLHRRERSIQGRRA